MADEVINNQTISSVSEPVVTISQTELVNDLSQVESSQEPIIPPTQEQINETQKVETTSMLSENNTGNTQDLETKNEEPVVVKNEGNIIEENKSGNNENVISSLFILNMQRAKELLVKARMAVQFRKKEKLEKIMTLFVKKKFITNNDVEKLLHISDATARAYLLILKKENRIVQSGKIGKEISYAKV